MGGGSSSKNKSDVVVKSVARIITKNIQECISTTILSQKINIHGDHNVVVGNKLSMAYKFSGSCLSNSKTMADLQNKILTQLKQSSAASNIALLGALGKSDSETDSSIMQELQNTINTQTIQKAINTTNGEQGIDIHGNYNTVKYNTLEMSVSVLQKNVQDVVNTSKVVNDLNNKTNQKSSATQTNPLAVFTDMINGFFHGLQGLGLVGDIMILGIFGIIAYFILGIFGGSDNPSAGIAAASAVSASNLPSKKTINN